MVEVMELDDAFVRVYCACVLVFPLSLLLVGLSKMRAFRHSHAAAVATYAAENEPSVLGEGGGGGQQTADQAQAAPFSSSATTPRAQRRNTTPHACADCCLVLTRRWRFVDGFRYQSSLRRFWQCQWGQRRRQRCGSCLDRKITTAAAAAAAAATKVAAPFASALDFLCSCCQ
jgi:hypothetical protein